ncbi:MAG: ABC transporter permease [Syntrophorhabdaceae bacterium]|nr:ABC transporter permease [Syntrophorhabdaceae bacterium]
MKSRSMFADTLRRLFRNPLAIAGAAIILFFLALALFPTLFSAHDPNKIDILRILDPPSARHLLGTDDLGRDVLARMVYGARISLSVGFVAESIAIAIGLIVGLLAGYYGGRVDAALMRFVDIMLCFPSFFLILSVVAFIGPSIWNIMFIIGITGWMGVARLVRAETLSLKERDFVAAASAQGAGAARIMFRHILPNTLAPILVAATLGVAGAILIESSLSFLGIGVQPPTPSWGNILTAGKDNIEFAWWLSLFPGLAIFLTVLGYNLLGEGIRDAVDPRLKGR